MLMMKYKIIWSLILISFLIGTEINAQREAMENPTVEVKEKKFLRYGIGITSLGTYNGPYVSLDFEVGYNYRINSFLSTSAHFNYGFSLEDGVYFQALQSHTSWNLLFAPTKHNKEYIFKIGGGVSMLAAHEIYSWNRENLSGVFPGYSVVMENEIFQKKRNNYLVINLLFGGYSNGDTVFGLSVLRGISISKIKADRKRVKELLR